MNSYMNIRMEYAAIIYIIFFIFAVVAQTTKMYKEEKKIEAYLLPIISIFVSVFLAYAFSGVRFNTKLVADSIVPYEINYAASKLHFIKTVSIFLIGSFALFVVTFDKRRRQKAMSI